MKITMKLLLFILTLDKFRTAVHEERDREVFVMFGAGLKRLGEAPM